jgi:integrase
MRGRKVTMGKTSITVYARHNKRCTERADNSGLVKCDCIRWMQFRDGSRDTTGQWTWTKAEEVARKRAAEMEDGPDTTPVKFGAYPVEQAIDEWIAEREGDGLRNTKAKYLTTKLLDWCGTNNIESLNQIQKQALRVWRTKEWRYRTGDSTSLKVHWSVLNSFFDWCVDGDLLEANPCPKRKGKIEQREVAPLTPQQMDALEIAVEKMRTPGWTDQRRLKMRVLILLMRWSGMAIHDAVHLERDANAVTRLIGNTVHGKRSKTKKKFSVTIPDSIVNLLQSLSSDHPRYFFWHRRRDGSELRSIVQMFGGWFGDVFKMAGIKGHSHQLRHSFATYHLSRGVPVERVAEWMGDSVAEVLKTYGHWIPERQEQSDQAMRDSWAKMGLDVRGNPVDATAVPTNHSVQ